MSIQKIVFFFIAVSFSFHVFSQQSAVYTNHLTSYQKALTLYENQQYTAAQALFTQIKKTAETEVLESDCAFYIANCAVRLNQQNADQLMEDFVNDYTTNIQHVSSEMNMIIIRHTIIIKIANVSMQTTGMVKYIKPPFLKTFMKNSITTMVMWLFQLNI